VQGENKNIMLKTDAANNLLTRKDSRARFVLDFPRKSGVYAANIGPLRGGHMRIQLEIPANTPVGAEEEILCSFELADGKTLTDARKCVVIVPPPQPPSNDPPTTLRIISATDPIQLKQGRRGIIHLESDGPDELLSRGVAPAELDMRFGASSGLLVVGHTDLLSHRIRIFVRVPADIAIGAQDMFEVSLTPSNGTKLSASIACVVVKAPEAEPGEKGLRRAPNYRIREVSPGDENWNSFGWDESWVGKHDKSGDLLILWVSVGYDRLKRELDQRSLTPERMGTFKSKYVALVGYHLWQHHQGHSKDGGQEIDDHEYQEEMRRTANTILLSMKPESEFDKD
jgi:hypothetical protein